MRILYLSSVGVIGGAERVLLTTIRASSRQRHEAYLLSCTRGPLLAQARSAGATGADVLPMPAILAAAGESGGALAGLVRTAAGAPLMSDYVRRLGRAIREIRPDLIHSNGPKTHVLASLARPTAAVIWHLHDFVGARTVTSKILRWLPNRPARAIAVSVAIAADAARVLSRIPVDVVSNAVDLTRFSPGEGDVAKLDGMANLTPPEGVIRLGLVATYARWKGQDVFLRAAARALKTDPGLPARFYVIGGPIYHTAGSQWSLEELRALAKELGIAAKVGFVPFVENPADLYRALDVVVHASTRPEPFGLTIAEAMACGRATIVSKAGGAAELFEDGIEAIGLPPGDEEALALAMAILVRNDDRRADLGAKATNAARRRFDENLFAQKLMAVYERVLRA